jgi:hypothetical protein
MATFDLQPDHPPSGDGGYEEIVATFFSVSLVATAATRWMATFELQPDHPPSGDGGYEEIVASFW